MIAPDSFGCGYTRRAVGSEYVCARCAVDHPAGSLAPGRTYEPGDWHADACEFGVSAYYPFEFGTSGGVCNVYQLCTVTGMGYIRLRWVER